MSSVTINASSLVFLRDADGDAVARTTVTTTDEDTVASFSFEVQRRPLILKIGTAVGLGDIINDTTFLPGHHIASVTPGVTTYHLEFRLAELGTATLANFDRIAPGELTLPTPWAATDLESLRYDQSLNTMWFSVINHPTQVLERRGQNSWSLRPLREANGPFVSMAGSGITMTPDGQTGTVNITSNKPAFETGDAGSLIRLTHDRQFQTATLDSVDDATGTIEVSGVEAARQFTLSITGTFVGTLLLERSIGNEFNFTTENTYTGTASATIDDELDNSIVYYRLRMSAYTSGSATATLTYSTGITDGIARIHSVTTDSAVVADVVQPFGNTTATALWDHAAWSDRYGNPAAVCNYDGRLWFGRGNAYWGSVSDDFENFFNRPGGRSGDCAHAYGADERNSMDEGRGLTADWTERK